METILGVVKDSVGKVREGLAKWKREREKKQSQSWFKSWFNSSPWLPPSYLPLLSPLIVLLLFIVDFWTLHIEQTYSLHKRENRISAADGSGPTI